MDSLLIGVPLGLLPLDAGRVLAQRWQLGLLVEQPLGALDGLLASRDGGDEGALGLRHDVELLRVLGLPGEERISTQVSCKGSLGKNLR